jgi:hypothetical protein
VRKQDQISGTSNTGGTVSGKTKGSKGISSIPSGGQQTATQAGRAVGGVGWPGEADSRPQNSDRTQSAP